MFSRVILSTIILVLGQRLQEARVQYASFLSQPVMAGLFEPYVGV